MESELGTESRRRRRWVLPKQRRDPAALFLSVATLPKSLDIDHICDGCQHHVPQSQQLQIIDGVIKDPRPRRMWLTNCPNCHDEWELLPAVDPDKFYVYIGATEHFSDAENVRPDPGGERTSDDGV